MLELFRFIHGRWSASAVLSRLVPPERLFTGAARSPTVRPYVVLVGGESKPSYSTSDTNVSRMSIEFRLWADDLEALDQLARGIAETFDRAEASLDEQQLLDLRQAATSETTREAEAWHVRMRYTALVANDRKQ